MCTHVHILLYCVLLNLCIFYTVVRQISMLFTDNKDSVFCMYVRVSWIYVRAFVSLWFNDFFTITKSSMPSL